MNEFISEISNVSIGNVTLTVTNNNGYGLLLPGTVTMTAAPTFSVANATASNLTQGLTLSGQLTGNFGFTKAGPGALVLAGASNNNLGTITVTQGVLSAGSDAVLGNTANGINLNGGANVSTFRATGTVNLNAARTITLSSTTSGDNAIEVTTGNTLTVNSAFGLGALTDVLSKNDNGTLVINANNPTWTGGTVVNAGAVLVNNAALTTPLGAATAPVTVLNLGSALQLSGGITLANPLTLTVNSNLNGGINSGGVLESVAGVNTWTGAITQTTGNGTTYGADTGATLNLAPSSYSVPGGNSMGFQGGGAINLQFALQANSSLNQQGTGTTTLSVASPLFVGPLNVNAGTFAISGTGAAIGITGLITVQPGANLNVVDTGTALANRLGQRPLSLFGGTLNYTVNATAASNETLGTFIAGWGNDTVNISNAGSQVGTVTLTVAAGFTINGGAVLNFTTGGGALGDDRRFQVHQCAHARQRHPSGRDD